MKDRSPETSRKNNRRVTDRKPAAKQTTPARPTDRKPTTGRSARSRRQQGIRLLWLVLALTLAAGCTLLIPPDELLTSLTTTRPSMQTTASSTTQTSTHTTTARPSGTSQTSTGPTTTSPTASASTAATSSVITTASTAAPTQTAASTTRQPAVTTTAGGSIDLAKLSLSALSWWYNRPSPLNQNVRTTISSSVAGLIKPWAAIWQANPTGSPTVYLTMDEGYEYGENTTEILDTASVKQVPIAFFITGSYVKRRPDLVKRMVNEGHLVLNHTDTHPNLATLYQEKGAAAVLADLEKLAAAYKSVTGKTMLRLVRPPAGAYSERLLGLLKQNGYRAVFWSFAYRDWITTEQPAKAAALDLILGELHDGSVILLHAVSDTNVAILPKLIDAIRARGYRFGLLTDIG